MSCAGWVTALDDVIIQRTVQRHKWMPDYILIPINVITIGFIPGPRSRFSDSRKSIINYSARWIHTKHQEIMIRYIPAIINSIDIGDWWEKAARDSNVIMPRLGTIMTQVCEPNLISIIQVSKREVQLIEEECTMSVKLHDHWVSVFQSPAITRTAWDTVAVRPHRFPSVCH